VPLDTPRIGAALQITVTNLPANVALLLLGFSNTSSSFGPLPLDLAAFGMPGCTAHTSSDALVFLVGGGGTAAFTLSIPGVAAFIGTRLYEQALVPDAAAGNALGAVMSDAATAVVGS
jgi:hypothetical protein